MSETNHNIWGEQKSDQFFHRSERGISELSRKSAKLTTSVSTYVELAQFMISWSLNNELQKNHSTITDSKKPSN